jgi:hypothetical protein
MKAWFWKNKGYIIHYAAVAVFFLNPSVQAFASSHTAYSAAIVMLWGTALHWATGK